MISIFTVMFYAIGWPTLAYVLKKIKSAKFGLYLYLK
jgi:hypothetical protein